MTFSTESGQLQIKKLVLKVKYDWCLYRQAMFRCVFLDICRCWRVKCHHSALLKSWKLQIFSLYKFKHFNKLELKCFNAKCPKWTHFSHQCCSKSQHSETFECAALKYLYLDFFSVVSCSYLSVFRILQSIYVDQVCSLTSQRAEF